MPQFYRINLTINAEDVTKVTLGDYVYQYGAGDDKLHINLPKEIQEEFYSSGFRMEENPQNAGFGRPNEYSKVDANESSILITLTYDNAKIEDNKGGFDSHYGKIKSIIENAFKNSSTTKETVAAKPEFKILLEEKKLETPPQFQPKKSPPLEDQLKKLSATTADLIKAVRVRPVASAGFVPKEPGGLDGKVFLIRFGSKDLRMFGLKSPEMQSFYGFATTVTKGQQNTDRYDLYLKSYVNEIDLLGQKVEIIQDPFDENNIPPDNNIINIGANELKYQINAVIVTPPEPPAPEVVEEPLPEPTPPGDPELDIPPDDSEGELSRSERTGEDPNQQSTNQDQREPPRPWLTEVFSPQTKAKEIRFNATVDKEMQLEMVNSIGYFPFIWYNAYQISVEDISFFQLYFSENIPAVKITFNDSLNKLKDEGFPLDDTKISIFLNPRSTQVKPIHLDFKITNFYTQNDIYTMSGILDVNKLYVKESKSLTNKSSYQALSDIARDAGLGFSSNIQNTDDNMTWINPGTKVYEFFNHIIDSSYMGDSNFLMGYIDYFYRFNLVDLEKELNRDIKQELGISNIGIEEITSVQKKENVSALFLTNDASMASSNNYFEFYKVINNSTSISLKRGYLTKIKYYDELQKNYLVFDVDSITSKGASRIILKGAPQDEEFYKQNIEYLYFGKMDTDNTHKNFQYSQVQNNRNIFDLEKICLEIELPTPNYNIYKFQKIVIMISNQGTTAAATHINNRLTGEWLVIDIMFRFDGTTYRQVMKLVKRELDLSPEELQNEQNQTPKAEVGESNNSNDKEVGGEENPVETPTTPETPVQVNQVAPGEFPLTKDMFKAYFRKQNGRYGLSPTYLEKLYPYFVQNLKNYKIDTPNRICSFLAVITTETGNLQNVTELASGQQYEGRNDLGNTQPGDGVKYKGRGIIQLTGRVLYKKAGDDIGKNLVTNPQSVASDNATWRKNAATEEQINNTVITATRYFAKGSAWGDLRKFADAMDITKPLILGSFTFNDLPNTPAEARTFTKTYGAKKRRNFATSFSRQDPNLYNYTIIQFGVNGGYNGFGHRCENWDRARKLFV